MSAEILPPNVLLTVLIGSFSALVALTAFHSFVIVHHEKIRSAYYRRFASFFGRGAGVPILMLYAFAILMESFQIVGLDYQVIPIVNLGWHLKTLCLFILGLGWYYTIVGIALVTINFLRDHLVLDIHFK